MNDSALTFRIVDAVHQVFEERHVLKVERAVRMSAEKYCSASIMLGAMAEITHDFEIVEVT